MKTKFYISIIGLNKLEATQKCLESVRKNSGDRRRYFLHLTNNGSTDGTADFFDEEMHNNANTMARHNKTNEGFIAPNCAAFEEAIKHEIPYFICLNNDTEVSPGWLDYLAAPLDIDPNGALSGPGFYGLKADMHGTDGVHGEYIEGSCLCAKVSLVSRHGPLFSDYLTFIYGDDSDLSLRMTEAGYKIYHTPFPLAHPRCTTVKQSPEVKAICDAAQAKNHDVLLKRWGHYLKTNQNKNYPDGEKRRMDYPIILHRHIACGDTLLLTPVIRAIRQSNPRSPIFVETKSPDVLKNNPHIHSAHYPVSASAGDLVIDLEMAYEDRESVHIIDAYADAVREQVPALGPVDHHIEMFPRYEDVRWAIDQRVMHRWSTNVCLMHIDHGGWPGKNWPKERFGEVATFLVRKGWHVVLIGSQLPPGQFDGFDMTGKTTTMQLAALLKTCQLFIGGDSFPMHAAVAMGCPTIGIFGVTDSKYIMADGKAPIICLDGDPAVVGTGARHREAGSRCVVTTDDCIKSVAEEQVFAAIEELI